MRCVGRKKHEHHNVNLIRRGREVLIFRKLRRDRFIPSIGGSLLSESNVRILWASWHALTVFGWAIAFLLFWLSQHSFPRGTIGIAI